MMSAVEVNERLCECAPGDMIELGRRQHFVNAQVTLLDRPGVLSYDNHGCNVDGFTLGVVIQKTMYGANSPWVCVLTSCQKVGWVSTECVRDVIPTYQP